MIRRYPCVLLLTGIVAGIVVADQIQTPSWILLLASTATCAGGVTALVRKTPAPAMWLFVVGVGLFAGFHFSVRYVDVGPDHLKRVLAEPITCRVFGRVADWPDIRADRTEVIVAVDSLTGEYTRCVRGGIMLKVTDTSTTLQRGDRVEFVGRIQPVVQKDNPDGFDYHHYLNLKGVYGLVYLPSLLDVRVEQRSRFGLRSVVDNLRGAVSASLKRNLEPVQAALAGGFLIGETRGIPKTIYKMFRDSGTLHLLAVSGSNVALVLLFSVWVLRPFRLSRKTRQILLLAVIVVFAELSYEEPSVMRASVMAGLVVAATLLQRRFDLNNIIAATAVIILMAAPAQLYDVGFQLSFITAWSLIFAVPRIASLLAAHHRRRWYRWLVFPLLVSLVAQVASAPVVAYHFGRVPAISLLANLLIVPLVSIGVIAILLMLLADLVWPILGLLAGSLVNELLGVVVWCLHWLGGDNMPVITTGRLLTDSLGVWIVLAVYLLLALVVVSLRVRAARKYALLAALLAVNLIAVKSVGTAGPSEDLSIEARPVPGGLATLIRQPSRGPTDLAFTGLYRRNYRVDEAILGPWLQARGVDRLHRVFVLSGDYGAVDDLLRLADRFRADTVYFSAHLRHSVADAVALAIQVPQSLPELRFFDPSPQDMAVAGYYLTDLGLAIRADDAAVFITDHLSGAHRTLSTGQGDQVLILGETWRPSSVEWAEFRERYCRVICSKIELPSTSSPNGEEPSAAELPAGFADDVGRRGSILLRISANGKVLAR